MIKQNYDAVVIGFGKGGKTLAAKLAQSGKTVAVVEMDEKMYGGTCINVGCIPSKSLILSAGAVDKNASFEEKKAKFKSAVEEKRRLTSMLRKKNFDKLDAFENVTVINGRAKFLSNSMIEAETESESYLLSAGAVLINTGSVSRIPEIEGIHNTAGVYTSRELMDLDELPEKLVIIGGGYIGLEFASMFAAFGSEVTVLQNSLNFLPREDEDVAAEIKSLIEAQGVKFKFGASTKRVENKNGLVELTVSESGQDEKLTAQAVLVATGRVPNTEGLGCEAAGIELAKNGAVVTDEYLKTKAPGVWAMGDVTGGMQHTYISLDDSRIVVPQILGARGNSLNDRKNVPYSVFMKTPYSRVGLNEREAKERGYNVKISRLPTAAVPKAQVLRAPEGFLKAVTDEDTGLILGAMLLCPESYEMINVVKLAMDLNADRTVLRDRIYTHPTMTEALNDLF